MNTSSLRLLAILGMSSGLVTATYAQPAPPEALDAAVAAQPVQVNSNGIVVMDPYAVRADVPRLIETAPMNVGPEFAGEEIDMLFRVDENGRAYNIDADTTNLPDRYFNVRTASLVTQLRTAIQNWQFEPARDADGRPIDRLVRLPIRMGDLGFQS